MQKRRRGGRSLLAIFQAKNMLKQVRRNNQPKLTDARCIKVIILPKAN